jgi:membrane-bound lytic murein transglycosylase D
MGCSDCVPIFRSFSLVLRRPIRQQPGSWLMVAAAIVWLGGCAHDPASGRQPASAAPAKSRLAAASPAVGHAGLGTPAGIGTDAASPLPDTFSASSLVDRAVARHRHNQQIAALATGPTYQSLPRAETKSSARNRRRSPAPVPPPPAASDQDAAAVFAALAPTPAPCTPKPAIVKTRRGPSRSVDAPVDCPPIQASTVGPPDMRMVQKTPARRGDVWESVRGGLLLAGVQHERLEAHLEHLRQRPGMVDFLMGRAEPYLPYLLDEIKRQGLPNDLVLVPMVESAFQNTAVSNKQAAGLWQFIPSTGQRYGLQQTETYDGRYDTHPATQAALKYLKHLNRLFNGDWLLTFAAYNAGEGAVQRAMAANRLAGGGGTFWELDLPSETQNYVVKILALSKVVADPASHGFRPRKAAPRNMLARIEARPEVHISDLIARSGIAPDDFYRLNPAFKPDVEPPAQPHNFLLPLEKAEILMAANMPGAKVFAPRKVVARKGDTLTVIAKRHGVPEFKLSEWNGIPPKAPLKVGQEILVMGV